MIRMHRQSRQLLFALGISLLLGGCSEKVLEASNAMLRNGKFYRDGADEPFTGRVTNVDEAVILPTQRTIGLFQTLGNVTKDKSTLDRVVFYKGLCEAKVKDGLLQGKAVCKFPGTDAKRWDVSFDEGRLDGDLTFYGPPPENIPLINARFNKGLQDGGYEVFSVKTGKRILKGTFKEGHPEGEETAWDQDNGNVTGKASYSSGKLNGPIIRYASDGKTVLYRATLVDGLMEGTEESFDESGSPLKHVEWKNGRKNGLWKQWERGEVIIDADCHDDKCPPRQPVNQPSEPTGDNACVQSWITAYRKIKGEDAAVMQDQVSEWEDWCKQGKKPE